MDKNIDLIMSLTGGIPLDYKFLEDGSLSVVTHTGQKFLYSKEQVMAARQPTIPELKLPPKPAPQPIPKHKK